MMGLEMTLQSIRALLILAAWTGELPAHAVGEKPGAQAQSLHLRVSFDGELLIGTAVRIASKMHLELDVEIALVHKREQAKSKAPPAPLNAKTLDRARMVRTSFVSPRRCIYSHCCICHTRCFPFVLLTHSESPGGRAIEATYIY